MPTPRHRGMTHETATDPGMGLYYEDLLPLRCRALDGAPDNARLAHVREASEETLRVFSVLDEYHPELNDEHPAIARELQRMDFKINLLLELVSQVLTRDRPLPPAVPVRLATASLSWTDSAAPAVGSWVELELYLSPRYPAPLTLLARIQAVEAENGASRVTADFGTLTEPVQEWLEKTIFRRHRRQIAQTRRPRH
jgi:hypothetical protein